MKTTFITIFSILWTIFTLAQTPVNYQYDNDNRIINSDDGVKAQQYQYDNLGNRTSSLIESSIGNTPDLTVSNIVIPNTNITQGETYSVSCRINNIGNLEAPSSVLKVYVSAIDTGTDIEVGSFTVADILAGNYEDVTFDISIPDNTNLGNQFLVFFIDAILSITEENEDNNKNSEAVVVSQPNLAELQFQNANVAPISVQAGNSVNLSANVHNTGSVDAGNFNVKSYLSLNATYEANDIELVNTSETINLLAANTDVLYTKTALIPANTIPGNYFVLFIVDFDETVIEIDETNNITAVSLVVINNSGTNTPVAEFIADNQLIEIGDLVQFTDQSTNNPTSWNWSFPGGTPSTSTLQNPIVQYNSTGDYDVTLIASNGNGNNNENKNNYITVETDTTLPIAICQNVEIQLDEFGLVTIAGIDIDNGSTDNIDIVSYELDFDTFNCSNIGDNPVILTVSDAAGNSSTCNAIVTVVDQIPPTAITQNITVQLDILGTVSIIPEDINNNSIDNCSISNLSLDIDTFTCNNVGDNIVTLTVEDTSNNSHSATAIVTVEAPISTFISGSWDITPNAGTKIFFKDNYSTNANGDVTACSCEIEVGKTVVVNAGNFIKITKDILVKGALDIEHEGSLVQIDDNASTINNGSIVVRKITPNLDSQDFMVLGSPMTSETREGVYGTGRLVKNHITGNFIPNPDVEVLAPGTANWADDNGDNWANHTGLVNPGEGYLVFPQPTQTSSGVFNLDYTLGTLNNGITNFNVLYNGTQNSSPNILANPYASAIDADLFMNANIMINEVYFWEHITAPSSDYPGYYTNNFNMGDISVYNSGSGGVAAANGVDIPSKFISSGQGFGIKATAAGTAIFNNMMRVTGPNDTYRSSIDRQRIWLQLKNEAYKLGSNILIAFTEGATVSYEPYYDSKRLATPVSLYSVLDTGEELAIQGRNSFDEEQIVPLGFSTMVEENQTYTISIRDIEGDDISNATVYLEDRLLNTITELSEVDFTFTSNVGDQTDRFVLLFRAEILGNTDNLLNSISIFPNPTTETITILSPNILIKKISILDIRGRLVKQNIINEKYKISINISELESAPYLIKIYTINGSSTHRILKH